MAGGDHVACRLWLGRDTPSSHQTWCTRDTRGGAVTEWGADYSAFWTVGRKKITNLIASAKDQESAVLNFRASSLLSVPMEDTTRCLHELRLAIASQDADPSAAGKVKLSIVT